MRPLKRFLRSGFKALLRVYFGSIEEVGERPSAETRGRVFVSNHKNALLDPVLVLTHAPCDVSPLAKSTLWDLPGLAWLLDLADAVPVLRRSDDPNKPAGANDEMFDRIAKHLASGGNVLVFPEGTSHNEPAMIRLKTGAARMLARAAAAGATDLTFQAVGLEFAARDKFRTRAMVAYGPVRRVADVAGDLIEGATARMHDDLEDLVIEGATWDERRLVLRIAELIRNEQGERSFAEAVRIAQGVERARDRLRRLHPEVAEAVERAVGAYLDALDREGLTDEQLSGPREEKGPSALAWAALPLFPIGVALYWVPYQLPRLVARRTDETDQHSTLKFATGLVAYPVWAIGLGAAAFVALRSRAARAAAIGVIVASPFAALHWLENARELRRALRLARKGSGLGDLLELRRVAMDAIDRARAAAAE
ncbi:MAG: 1-acyl-sn-glycerol-3-phosphate acyltransferase [Polyangiaceae bacterium]